MALIQDYKNNKNGLHLKNAYYRIIKVEHMVEENNKYVFFVVDIFAKKKTRNDGLQAIERTTYSIPTAEVDELFNIDILGKNGMNSFKRGYEYLKSLPEFKDSEDDL